MLVSMSYLFYVTTQGERILFKGDQGEGRRQIKILWRRGNSKVGVFRRCVFVIVELVYYV
jgi:hypothetical protein